MDAVDAVDAVDDGVDAVDVVETAVTLDEGVDCEPGVVVVVVVCWGIVVVEDVV